MPPNSRDVDCRGGTGDGPDYAHASNFRLVNVANDPYDLDRDDDGLACEADDLGDPSITPAKPAVPVRGSGRVTG